MKPRWISIVILLPVFKYWSVGVIERLCQNLVSWGSRIMFDHNSVQHTQYTIVIACICKWTFALQNNECSCMAWPTTKVEGRRAPQQKPMALTIYM